MGTVLETDTYGTRKQCCANQNCRAIQILAVLLETILLLTSYSTLTRHYQKKKNKRDEYLAARDSTPVLKWWNTTRVFITVHVHCSDLFLAGANNGVYKSSQGNAICSMLSERVINWPKNSNVFNQV